MNVAAPHCRVDSASVCVLLWLLMAIVTGECSAQTLWQRHTIDNGSRGADGVRLGDVNRDGRPDIVTGWEEGGRVRICLQPTSEKVREPWPVWEVGQVKSPEDAVFADVNHDGWLDVVSCCEGKTQSVFFHINPGTNESGGWKTEVVPESVGRTRWMFCEPLDERRLVFGSKEPHAEISLLDLSGKREFRKLRSCGWIMSLRKLDVDNDGDPDILYSDRKGARSGIGWLENPGNDSAPWNDHSIGGAGVEVMFLDVMESNDGLIVAANTRMEILLLTSPSNVQQPWNLRRIAHPQNVGTGKGIRLTDLNSDGRPDLVCTCENSQHKSGVCWLQQPSAESPVQSATEVSAATETWSFHDISGANTGDGIKFDRIEILDIDGDGDRDVLTCEERDNLGVIWYENPERSRLSE
ncbi:MAG: FG-GAP-like repeat-containing protein [Planctomycetaceae bacterium]